MSDEFPGAVAEIPVTEMVTALAYYEETLGFNVDWGRDGGGIAGIHKVEAGYSSRSHGPGSMSSSLAIRTATSFGLSTTTKRGRGWRDCNDSRILSLWRSAMAV